MRLIEHLNIIEELVLNRASPAEIRPHLLAMRPALEAYDEKDAEFIKLQSEKAAIDAKLLCVETELAKMKAGPTATVIPKTPYDRRHQSGIV